MTLWSPALILPLALLFALALAVTPLRSARNLDAAVLATGFAASALMLDARLVAAHVFAGMATLAYVAWRCARVGLGPPPLQSDVKPLYKRVARRVDAERMMALTCVALLIAGVMLTVTSTQPSDVAAAALAGATLLNHGVVPYGHLPGFVVHGDTYPLFTYVIFMPAAALGPVHNGFDSLTGALWVNAVALVVAAAGMARLGGRAQMAAWVAFPPVLLAASAGGNDVPSALLVVAALLTFGRPLAEAALVSLAGWVKIVPAAALVVLLARGRSRAALAVVAGVVIAFASALLALDGTGALSAALDALRFQLVRGSWYSLWQQLGAHGVQLAFQAATVGFAAAVAVYAYGQRSALGLRRSAGLAGALIALLQIGANNWQLTYLAWLLPFILVALFPPAPRRSPQPGPAAP